MDALLLVLAGMAVVLGGILVLRLHAFLALILGALTVGLLTPDYLLQRYGESKGMGEAAVAELLDQNIILRITEAFGSTAGKIGILISMASIIGLCLLKSGAADRIVRAALRLFGEKRVPVAFISSGFVLGVPVFFDTVFYLMVPLGRSMAIRTGKDYALYLLSIVMGAAFAHSLIPPTPGPLFVAEEMGINLGSMIMGGIIIGVFCMITGYVYAQWANKKFPVPVREMEDVPQEEMEAMTQKADDELPPLWLSLLPIVLPVILISGKTIVDSLWGDLESLSSFQASFSQVIDFVGDSTMALTLAAGFGLILLARQKMGKKAISVVVQDALQSGGIIILITCAGGAFGSILQQTGIGPSIQEVASSYKIGILPLTFILTAVIRGAQGSATVAMITALGVMGGMADPEILGFHPLYLALAIGVGSMPLSWMNDSGFWIVCKMSGMTEQETLRHWSVILTLMGLTGILVIMVGANLFPLVA